MIIDKEVSFSIVITSCNDDFYLCKLLQDLDCQVLHNCKILEILIIEAGDFSEKKALEHLKIYGQYLKFFNFKNLSRTKALNFLFNYSKGDIILRLDSRTHIENNYLNEISDKFYKLNIEVCGGVIYPIGITSKQIFISKVLTSKFIFGGGNFRKSNFKGFTDSVYLGAYNRSKCKIQGDWFSEGNSSISEDSDLNYRIRKSGGKIYVDSDIKVYYYCRETYISLFKMFINYGIARGLFILNHSSTSAPRQNLALFISFLIISFTVLGFINDFFHFIQLISFMLYVTYLLIEGINKGLHNFKILKYSLIIILCQALWVSGLFISPLYFIFNINTNKGSKKNYEFKKK